MPNVFDTHMDMVHSELGDCDEGKLSGVWGPVIITQHFCRVIIAHNMDSILAHPLLLCGEAGGVGARESLRVRGFVPFSSLELEPTSNSFSGRFLHSAR